MTDPLSLTAPIRREDAARQPAQAEGEAQTQARLGRCRCRGRGGGGGRRQAGAGHDARGVPAAKRDALCPEPHGRHWQGGARRSLWKVRFFARSLISIVTRELTLATPFAAGTPVSSPSGRSPPARTSLSSTMPTRTPRPPPRRASTTTSSVRARASRCASPLRASKRSVRPASA
jgi:hypothetical protein